MNKDLIKYLLKLLIPYKIDIIVIFFILIICSLFNLILPIFSKNIMDKGFIGGNYGLLIKLVLGMILINIINILLNLFKEKKRIEIKYKIEYKLKKQAFNHITNLKMKYFETSNSTEILNNIETDIGNISSISDENLIFVLTQIFNIIGGLIGLIIINFKLTLMVILFIPLKYFLTTYLSKRATSITNKIILSFQDYSKFFGDTIDGIREIKIFSIYNYKEKQFLEKVNETINQNKRLEFNSLLNFSCNDILMNILILMLYIIGGNLVFNLNLSIGSVFAFITYSAYVTAPISAIINIKYYLSRIIPSAERYNQFLKLEEEDTKLNINEQIKGNKIKFENVSLGYNNEILVENINFELNSKEKIAIIGKNGSGKTTLIKTLLRFYDNISGNIKLDDINIENINLLQYRKLFSVVSQDVYLFNDNIKNNICLYKDISEDLLNQIIIDSNLEDVIRQYGLKYIVGDNGCMLSGGQKQKIALARALVNDTPIIILDEATSNVDEIGEKYINNLLETKLKDKIVIVITHKFDNLNNFNKISEIIDNKVYIKYIKNVIC